MSYDPILISRFFIEKSFEEGVPVTNMKILKLVYIAHGWFLGHTGDPLINVPVMAWKYGPVIEPVYEKFKSYGRHNISQIPNTNASFSNDLEYGVFLGKVWDIYKKYDGLALSSLTHKQGTPWETTITKHGEFSIIPNNLIEEYYKKRIAKSTVN